MLRKVKLVRNARKLALERGAPIGFLTDPNQDVRAQDDQGKVVDLDKGGFEVEVANREYHLLKAHGLIDIEATRLVAPAADQPEADEARLQAQRDEMEANAEARQSSSTRGDEVDTRYRPDVKAVKGPVHDERGPSGTDRGVHPGGVGHDPDDANRNADRTQRDIRALQGQGTGAKRAEDREVSETKGDSSKETKRGDTKDTAKGAGTKKE